MYLLTDTGGSPSTTISDVDDRNSNGVFEQEPTRLFYGMTRTSDNGGTETTRVELGKDWSEHADVRSRRDGAARAKG